MGEEKSSLLPIVKKKEKTFVKRTISREKDNPSRNLSFRRPGSGSIPSSLIKLKKVFNENYFITLLTNRFNV